MEPVQKQPRQQARPVSCLELVRIGVMDYIARSEQAHVGSLSFEPECYDRLLAKYNLILAEKPRPVTAQEIQGVLAKLAREGRVASHGLGAVRLMSAGYDELPDIASRGVFAVQ